MEDILLDIETLGNEGNFIVLSVGLVQFDIRTGKIGDKFIINLSETEQAKHGFNVSAETMLWWSERMDMFHEVTKDQVCLENGCGIISRWLQIHPFKRCWASATLDYQGISNIFFSQNLPNPIPYDKRLCCRTIREIYKFNHEYIHPDYTHNPVDDCENEIKELVEQLNTINIWKEE